MHHAESTRTCALCSGYAASIVLTSAAGSHSPPATATRKQLTAFLPVARLHSLPTPVHAPGDLYATSLLHRFTTARQRETCARQLSHAGGQPRDSARQPRDSRETARDSARQPRDSRESYVNLCNKPVAYRSEQRPGDASMSMYVCHRWEALGGRASAGQCPWASEFCIRFLRFGASKTQFRLGAAQPWWAPPRRTATRCCRAARGTHTEARRA